MLFHEIYGNYYNAIAKIITAALNENLDNKKINRIISDTAFGESFNSIPDKIKYDWGLIDDDNISLINNVPKMPLTTLQKRWLKAICMDRRIKLFSPDETGLDDIEPLFTADDIVYYDKSADSDPYDDETYIRIFKILLAAVKDLETVRIKYYSARKIESEFTCVPQFIEYSPEDDKFRVQVELINSTNDTPVYMMLNLSRIISCDLCDESDYDNNIFGPRNNEDAKSDSKERHLWIPVGVKRATVTIEIYDERNSLERALLSFSHLERNTKRIDDKTYQMTITYDATDETKLLINIMSFGPTVKVIAPASFVTKLTERLTNQKLLNDSQNE